MPTIPSVVERLAVVAEGARPRIAILVPCYNEELTIADVVRQFRVQLPDAAIYVFDNNSSDRTADEACRSRGKTSGRGATARTGGQTPSRRKRRRHCESAGRRAEGRAASAARGRAAERTDRAAAARRRRSACIRRRSAGGDSGCGEGGVRADSEECAGDARDECEVEQDGYGANAVFQRLAD